MPDKAIVGGRGVLPPGQGIASRMPKENGIMGGRPVTPSTGGRPAVGIPRGMVIGNEGTTGARGPMGRGMPGMPGMQGGPMGGAGQSGIFWWAALGI